MTQRQVSKYFALCMKHILNTHIHPQHAQILIVWFWCRYGGQQWFCEQKNPKKLKAYNYSDHSSQFSAKMCWQQLECGPHWKREDSPPDMRCGLAGQKGDTHSCIKEWISADFSRLCATFKQTACQRVETDKCSIQNTSCDNQPWKYISTFRLKRDFSMKWI